MTESDLLADPNGLYIDRRIGLMYPIIESDYMGRCWIEKIKRGESAAFWLRKIVKNENGFFVEVAGGI